MKNRWIQNYICTLSKDLKILLLANFIFLLILETTLIMMPTMWHVTKTICEIAATLSISFFASFIFYFGQVHLPEIRHKANVYPSIANIFESILLFQKSLLTNFVGVKEYRDLTDDVIRTGVTNRNVHLQDAPLHMIGPDRSADWIEYGMHQVNSIDDRWELLMKYSSYLDSECISILADIREDSLLHFFRSMRKLYNSLQFGELHGFEDLFLKFWYSIQQQEKYYNENFAIFRQH